MDGGLESLFTNEEYKVQSFAFGPHTLRLKLLDVASTDYDLTGQVLWPAAKLLAAFLAARPKIFCGRACACELGAGLGLAGLLAAQHCPVVLTDHNPIVMSVLQQNAELNKGSHPIQCELMDWEEQSQVEHIRSLSPGGQGYDLVLGADVCYGLKALPSIFRAFSLLLAESKTALGLLGYVSRAAAIDRGIYTEAAAAGLHIIEVPGTQADVGAGLQGAVYEIRRVSAGSGSRRQQTQHWVVPAAACLAAAWLVWRRH